MSSAGTGHSQTRPGAFKDSCRHSLEFGAVHSKVCTGNVMRASDWTVFCPWAARLRIRLINKSRSRF